MYKKLSILLLLSGSICAAQTVTSASQMGPCFATPTADTQTAPTVAGMEGTQQTTDATTENTRQKAAPCAKNEEPQTDNNNVQGTKQAQRTTNQQVIRSDFELFAADAAGHPLSVYGRELFSNPASTFAPMDRVPVPADYVLGPGDQIELRVWGMVDFQA